MMKEVHGGNIYKFDHPIYDFSANLNPLGMPEPVRSVGGAGRPPLPGSVSAAARGHWASGPIWPWARPNIRKVREKWVV